jgi:aspartyl-tRNA(Asn)/glutamyl-tRNA(Gln) amidotransferase subunit A
MIDWTDLGTRNRPLNAFVDWDKGATGGNGPLAGLTVGIKANIAVKGLPWTAGMGTSRDIIADRDAAVVAQLRAAGATILGTLNMHEAALGATTDNAFYGRTHNPHRHGYSPGGSSGGSGAAVAAGLCDAALGTDTLGSIRIPAAYCGVYGLKPTHGAVSDEGLVELEPRFDCIGPLARDLDVLERVWETLKNPFVSSAVETPSRAGSLDFARDERLLVLTNLANIAVEPAVRAAYDRILSNLPQAEEITLPDSATDIRLAGFIAAGKALIAALGSDRTKKADLISTELHAMLDYCDRATPRPDVLARTRAALIDAIGDDGVFIMPTAPQAAFAHGSRAPANQADFTALASIAGLPALAIPAGLNEDGLPVSVQIVGPAHSETHLIALARTLV